MLRSQPALRLRRGLARRADQVLAAFRLVEPRAESTPSVAWADPMTDAQARESAASAAPEPTPADDVVGAPLHAPVGGLTREAVQEVLDEMVRPALQSDGGDITLVDVVGGDVMVQLVGACHSCPSAVLTMKMGVEQLLAEELDGFERLIQVNDGPPSFE